MFGTTLVIARIVLPFVMMAFTVSSMLVSNRGDGGRARYLQRLGLAAISLLIAMDIINPRADVSFRIYYIGLVVCLAAIILAIRRKRLGG